MTMKAGDSVFVDTNILIYATVAESPWHALARDALKKHSVDTASVWISRQVIRI